MAIGAPHIRSWPPPESSPEGLIDIPKIGVDQVFVEGTAFGDLRRGPGHYAGTPFPGQRGNASLAGHRTTYGAPFYNLDRLRPGDKIVITTSWGTFWYDFRDSFVVDASDVSVIAPTPNNQLTLTTCTPRFSAKQRLIIQASLVGSPTPALPVSARPELTEATPQDSKGAWMPAGGWGLITMAVAVSVWMLARRRRRRWPVYLLAAPVVLAGLIMFFAATSAILPDMV
jgi:sortase A